MRILSQLGEWEGLKLGVKIIEMVNVFQSCHAAQQVLQVEYLVYGGLKPNESDVQVTYNTMSNFQLEIQTSEILGT